MRVLLLLLSLFVLAACDLSKSDGPSDNDLSALKTELNDQISAQNAKITALEVEIAKTQKATNTVKLSTGSSAKSGVNKASDFSTDCTYVGYLNGGTALYQADHVQCKSATGYLFAVPAPNGGKLKKANVSNSISFATPDCTGQAYAGWGIVSEYGLAQGSVFDYDDATGEQVGYIPAGSEKQSVAIWSSMMNTNCTPSNGDVIDQLIAISPNDPLITGVSNDPYVGPIVIQ